MAVLIPILEPKNINNKGEKIFYEKASGLSDKYTVFYSKYFTKNNTDYEVDFIIFHEEYGFVCIEVKGHPYVKFENNQFHLGMVREELALPAEKQPHRQAERAMHHFKSYLSRGLGIGELGANFSYDYAIFFACSQVVKGTLPPEFKDKVFGEVELNQLDKTLIQIFDKRKKKCLDIELKKMLIAKAINILNDSFKLVQKPVLLLKELDKQLDSVFDKETKEYLLEATSDIGNSRCAFLGLAGTGKSLLAVQIAKEFSNLGKRVLLTCYGLEFGRQCLKELDKGNITAKCLQDFLRSIGIFVRDDRGINEKHLIKMENYFSEVSNNEKKYDVIIIDEAQDFKLKWLERLQKILKNPLEDSFFIFFDNHQNVNSSQNVDNNIIGFLKKYKSQFSTHYLLKNLRNPKRVLNMMLEFVTEENMKPMNVLNHEGYTEYIIYQSNDVNTPKDYIKSKIASLLKDGIDPKDIVILSYRSKKDNSILCDISEISGVKIIFDNVSLGIRYYSIRNFKGMEAKYVFLVDLKNERGFRENDLYCAITRAQHGLYCVIEDEFDKKYIGRITKHSNQVSKIKIT